MYEVDEETILYLDSVAMIVAAVIEDNKEKERMGEPPDENLRAILTLGEAYMLLYNIVLDNNNNNESTEDDN